MMARKSGRTRVPLSRERVLLAAVAFADEHGIASMSMRKLAQQVGVEAMSLYNHVANKDDVLDGMVELVAGELSCPALDGDWQAAMRARASSAHEVLVRHPWATQLIVSRVNIGPNMLRYIDATIGCLRAAGFSLKLADHAWNAIDSHIYGFTLQELNFPLEVEEYAVAAEAYLGLVPAETYPHLNAMTHSVIDGGHDGVHDLAFGLQLILDGLERLRA